MINKKLNPVSVAAALLLCGASMAAVADSARRPYVVQLKDQPVASYTGGITGLAATSPQLTGKLNLASTATVQYVSYLDKVQGSVLGSVPGAQLLHSYNVVYNGFSALLTDDEARTLESHPDVAQVQLDQPLSLTTADTPRFLGLDAPGGLWNSMDASGNSLKGENVVVGIIDSGIWPENPAFADKVDGDGRPTHGAGTQVFGPPPATWQGACLEGEGIRASNCNNKLIGLRHFNTTFLSQVNSGAIGAVHWSEFMSARDSVGGPMNHGGHGTHTASTAAGNAGVQVDILGNPGAASGMAPRARVAAYKVCWTFVNPNATDGTGSQNTCYQGDSVRAIEAAVKDGVNVLNFSISGGEAVSDIVEQAFLGAANAGVFVAASAGNSGPGNAVAHISPWLTTVGASTHDRWIRADVQLANGKTYFGSSANRTPLPMTDLIAAENAGLPGVDAAKLALCYSNVNGNPLLDPAKVAGKIVVCIRGENARVDKSLAVANAGGAGMVMVDNGGGLVAEAHSVPTVHLGKDDGTAVLEYARTNGAKGLLTSNYKAVQAAPKMAGFSSRGPNRFDDGVLKPDVTAPGVDIFAGVAPDISAAERLAIVNGAEGAPAWASMQGTSMSSPHVAGLAALLRQARPDWSPAAIKSALMTTATSTLDDGRTGMELGTLPWGQGAGHVNPNAAARVGLVYDLGREDYLRYLCRVSPSSITAAMNWNCATTGNTLDASHNLNLPSITVGSVLGSTVVRRMVKNVGTTSATYTASITTPAGFTATVSPTTFTVAPGATQALNVTVAATASAVVNQWAYGKLTLTNGSTTLNSPVQLKRARLLTPPPAVRVKVAASATPTRTLTVKAGYSGTLRLLKGGMKELSVGSDVTLTPAPMDDTELISACLAGADLPNLKVHNVTIPADTVAAQFSLRNADTSLPGSDDFDMALVNSDGSVALYSGNAASTERVELAAPAAGNYKVCVLAYGTAPSAETMSYRMSSAIVTTADASSNLLVMGPPSVVSGRSAAVAVSWNGLQPEKRYLGGVLYRNTAGTTLGGTPVYVETTAAPVPTAASAELEGVPKSGVRRAD